MNYLIVSFTHKNTTLDVREKISFSRDDLKHSFLKKLNENMFINESIVLSTCNRTEVICSCTSVRDATEHIFLVLNRYSHISLQELEGHGDIYEDQGAIHHLFSVASSLDSMVIGETQITGQLKDAFKFSFDNNYCAQKLSRAMHYALKCAAEVRNSSSISSKPVSIASVAVNRAKDEIKNLHSKKVLVIGTGEMSSIIIKHLQNMSLDITLTNRTRLKADDLACECGGIKVIDFDSLKHVINEFDLIFTSTGSQKPIITKDMIKDVDFMRYWFDMAVPRDIDHIQHSKIKLYQIDDFKAIVSENMSMREEEARASYIIVGKYIISFYEWLNTLSIEPLIKELYRRAYESAELESKRVIEKGFIPKEYEKQVNKMAKQSIKRFLHEITAKMREASESTKSDTLTQSFMFLLDEDEDFVMKNEKCLIRS